MKTKISLVYMTFVSNLAKGTFFFGFGYCLIKRFLAKSGVDVDSSSSFISVASSTPCELELELEKTNDFITTLRSEIEEEFVLPSRKRELEESLWQAESAFNNLFELKSKWDQHQTNFMVLESRVNAEIAKSHACREILDSSPFKRQRTKPVSPKLIP